MTLPETMHKENTAEFRSSKTMGHLLMLSVKQACRRGGVHCGMRTCSQLFKSDAASVMLCVLPASCDQLSMQIHHTLIQALCNERDIPVILIKDKRRLESLIKRVTVKGRHGKVRGDGDDMNCVLIQYPAKRVSKYNKELIQNYNAYKENGMEVPLVDIPA